MSSLVAPVYLPTPGCCGAAVVDGGPRCGAAPIRPFPCGDRCAQHAPINRKTGARTPFLQLVKEAA